MIVSEISGTALAALDGGCALGAQASPPRTMRLLVVTANDRLMVPVGSAAADEGWQAVRHRLVDQALRAAVRTHFDLAMIDTQSVADGLLREEYEQLAVDLSGGHVPLIIISGEAGDPLGEIRARQLGVWLYLPGFDGATELDVVFREARAAHGKLHPSLQLGPGDQDEEHESWIPLPASLEGTE